MRHCFLLLLFTITFKGFSIDIPSKIKQFPITKGLPYFTTQHKLDPKEALNRFSTDSISIFKTENLGLNYAGVWTKIKLTNATNESKTYYLEVAFPRFDSVKIYDINNQLKQICISGDGYNFSAKSFKHRNTVLSLSFAPNEEKELLLFAKKDGDMSLPLYLWDTVAHEEKTYNENLSFGLIFGLYLFAVIISIVLSISFKTKLHFFYTLYSSFMFLALLGNYGFSHQLLFPNNSFLNNEGFAIIAQITVISLLLFGSEFVGVSKIKFPKINFTIFKICIFPLILFTVLYIITLLIGSLEQIGYAMFKISLVLYIIGLGTLLTRTVIGIVKKEKQSILFACSFLLLLAGIFSHTLTVSNFLPYNFLTAHGLLIGALSEICFLSIVLGFNIVFKLKENLRLIRAQNEKQKEITAAYILGEDKERERIAQDIHDEIGSNLTYLRLEIERNSPQQSLLEILKSTFKSTKIILHQITPPKHQSLKDNLDVLIENTKSISDLNLSLSLPKTDLEVDYMLGLSLYRTIKEALNNTIKHAHANHFDISISVEEQELNILLQDDGTGFDKNKISGNGNGLFNIETRIKQLGGQCSIDSLVGEGTIIAINIPL